MATTSKTTSTTPTYTVSNPAPQTAGKVASTNPALNAYYNAQVASGAKNFTDPRATQSTTTLSTGNIDGKIANNNATLTNLSDKGVKTDTTTGVSTTPDGQAYTPKKADTSAEDASQEAIWNEMKANTDAITAASIANIQSRYAGYKKAQEEVNKANVAGTTSALLMSGAAQHDVYSQDAITYRINQGNQAIQDLEAKENQEINEAKQLQLAGNQKILEQKLGQIQETRKAKIDAVNKLNETIADAKFKAEETVREVKKENAIVDLYTKGIKTPAQILQQLQTAGFKDITLEKILATVEALEKKPEIKTETLKLDNGNTILIDKETGKIIKSYGGAAGGEVTPSETNLPIIRTVPVDGKKMPVDGYALKPGDDPYFIAKNNGIDMATLQKLNPNITDWKNLPVGAVINLPSKSTGTASILAATGLSKLAFDYLTQGTTALTRMSEKTRKQVISEAENWANSKRIDVSTFKSQYSALGKTVEANTLRNNQAAVAESELDATIKNVKEAATEANLGSLAKYNAAKVWAGEQLNTKKATRFKFHLEQLRREFAMYNAAIEGQIDANGNIRQITDSDLARADEVINNGFAKGSIDGFEEALTASRSKMQEVLQQSINAQNRQVWKLFGVEDQFIEPTITKTPQDPMTAIEEFDKKNPDVIDAIHQAFPDATVEEIYQKLKDKGYL